jgi:hypothetical protein
VLVGSKNIEQDMTFSYYGIREINISFVDITAGSEVDIIDFDCCLNLQPNTLLCSSSYSLIGKFTEAGKTNQLS